ncbi:hypothetical protein AB0I53_13800 [Saccharopolyspora sp. NPDC050389]|uniref:hypothetical protein n=1 Tax=Saccharopolyspora sp. NPDC050389 TaxID=3155516 RepID=UPI003406BB5F
MTQQYLVGELSFRLALLQDVADPPAADRFASLRREVEAALPDALGPAVARAIRLVDECCWDSVRRGDVTAFDALAAWSAELHEFASCARLLDQEARK